MSMHDLLHIYSGTNLLMRFDFSLRSADYTLAIEGRTETRNARIMGMAAKLPRTVGGINELLQGLDDLVAKGHTFRRAVVSSHGRAGEIIIGGERIDANVLKTRFGNRNYHRLFLVWGRMSFVGCNVAEGDEGWKFLEAAGAVFLRSLGGVAFGWDSIGFALPWHTEHLWGDARYVTVSAGGVVIDRSTGLDQWKKQHPNAWFFFGK